VNKTVLVYSDTHDRCGVGNCNVALLRGLIQAGYRAIYCKPEEQSPPQRLLADLGVEFHWFDYTPEDDLNRFANDREMPSRIFADLQPDLIFFAKGQPMVLYGAIEAARLASIPYIVWEGSVSRQMLPADADVIGALRRQYECARTVFCLSQDNLACLHSVLSLPSEVGKVLPAPADPVFFNPVDPEIRRCIRRSWGVPADGVVCITSGQLEVIKGHGVVVRAIAMLKGTAEWPRLTFVWAGDGSQSQPLSTALERLGVMDKVKLLGHVWNVHEIMDAADIFVLTSLTEGMGRVFPEALAKGLPIIATRVGGIPEAVGAHAILLSPPTDPMVTAIELARAIRGWVNDAPGRKAFGEAGRTQRAPDFYEPRIIDEYLKIISGVVDPGHV